MAARGTAQRPNGAVQGKICQFKLVLLGECCVSSMVGTCCCSLYHKLKVPRKEISFGQGHDINLAEKTKIILSGLSGNF